jgi:hypothetical protein
MSQTQAKVPTHSNEDDDLSDVGGREVDDDDEECANDTEQCADESMEDAK